MFLHLSEIRVWTNCNELENWESVSWGGGMVGFDMVACAIMMMRARAGRGKVDGECELGGEWRHVG